MRILKNLHIPQQGTAESLMYLALWAVIFAIPVADSYQDMANGLNEKMPWNAILNSWSDLIPFLLVFLIHNHLIAPLLLRKRQVLYVILASLLLTGFSIHTYWYRNYMLRQSIEQRAAAIVQTDSVRIPSFISPSGQPQVRQEVNEIKENIAQPRPTIRRRLLQIEQIRIIIALLLIGMNLGVKFFFKSVKDEKTLQEMEKHRLKSELEYLKFQINPHFFMNTLNNIHALVDIDPKKAKQTVLVLSRLMRYILYESIRDLIPLSKETEFLEMYISLMRIRYSQDIDIIFEKKGDCSQAEIPPLLLITFVENAFKHGISYQKHSFIHISLIVGDSQVTFDCANSTHHSSEFRGEGDNHGIGLENVAKRLHLIYGDHQELIQTEKDQTFKIHLTIPRKP